MNAMAVPVQRRTDHLEALPRSGGNRRDAAGPALPPRLVLVDKTQEFRLEIERVGTGDPPSLMLWGEE